MGRKCCVPKCCSNYDASIRNGQSTISTFKFPDDEQLRDCWLRALGRGNNWQPGRTASICINHFHPNDIIRYYKPAKLKSDAVPLIFENHSQNPMLKRGRPKKNQTNIPEKELNVAMEDAIDDFESFSLLVNKKINLGKWHLYRNDKVLYFYNICETNVDIAIKIENSIKIYDNMKLKLFLMNVRQAEESLKWILGHDMKIRRWSQLEAILKKYDSKFNQLNDYAPVRRDESSVIHPESSFGESNESSRTLDLSMDCFAQQDEEIEFLAIENLQKDTITLNESSYNPLGSNNEGILKTKERIERKYVHEIASKLKSSKHKCFICQVEHESNEELQRHLPAHVVMLPFSCNQCINQKVTLKTLDSLNKHFLMHQKPLKCRLCNVRFSSYNTRILHEQNSHKNQGPFTCEMCGKISHSYRGHQHHYKVHTNPEAMKCKLCEKQLSSGYELKLHMRVHTKEKPNKCPFCQASFNRISNLVVHKRRLHATEKPFCCVSCGDEFGSNVELKRHATTHHDVADPKIFKQKSVLNCISPSSVGSKQKYYCETCDIEFQNSPTYHSHMRKHRKRYQCSYCGLRIGQFRDFIDHENTHTGHRPYKCDICLKTFKTSSTFYGHRAIHAAKKRFSCEVCERKFHRLRHLVIHKGSHAKNLLNAICSKSSVDLNS